jgi:hypothetical protein
MTMNQLLMGGTFVMVAAALAISVDGRVRVDAPQGQAGGKAGCACGSGAKTACGADLCQLLCGGVHASGLELGLHFGVVEHPIHSS